MYVVPNETVPHVIRTREAESEEVPVHPLDQVCVFIPKIPSHSTKKDFIRSNLVEGDHRY